MDSANNLNEQLQSYGSTIWDANERTTFSEPFRLQSGAQTAI